MIMSANFFVLERYFNEQLTKPILIKVQAVWNHSRKTPRPFWTLEYSPEQPLVNKDEEGGKWAFSAVVLIRGLCSGLEGGWSLVSPAGKKSGSSNLGVELSQPHIRSGSSSLWQDQSSQGQHSKWNAVHTNPESPQFLSAPATIYQQRKHPTKGFSQPEWTWGCRGTRIPLVYFY